MHLKTSFSKVYDLYRTEEGRKIWTEVLSGADQGREIEQPWCWEMVQLGHRSWGCGVWDRPSFQEKGPKRKIEWSQQRWVGIAARWSWVQEEVDFRLNRMCCYQLYSLAGIRYTCGGGGHWVSSSVPASAWAGGLAGEWWAENFCVTLCPDRLSEQEVEDPTPALRTGHHQGLLGSVNLNLGI